MLRSGVSLRGRLAGLLASVMKCLSESPGVGAPQGMQRDSSDPCDTQSNGTNRYLIPIYMFFLHMRLNVFSVSAFSSQVSPVLPIGGRLGQASSD